MLCSCSQLTASQSASTAPVCSSCPRTNATSCLSNALSFWSQRRDSPWESAAIRCNQMQSEAISGNQRQSETPTHRAAISGNQHQSAVIRVHQRQLHVINMQSEAIRGHQRQSYAIICNHMQSYAIGGNQRQSEAHHAVLMLAAHSVTERVDRPCVLELPEDEGDLVLEQRAHSFWSQRRDSQRQSETRTHRAEISGNQRQSAVIRVHQRQLHAIRGNQRPSEAIRGHQQTNRVRHLG